MTPAETTDPPLPTAAPHDRRGCRRAPRPRTRPSCAPTRRQPVPHTPGVVHAPGRPLAARSTAASARASACSSRAAGPTSSPRSPCSRCAATGSTPRSSSPTSSCRSRRSGSTSTSSPGWGRSSPRPIRSRADLAQLRDLTPDDVPDITESVRLLTAELGATPLIGFAGAPFTLASYLVEGGPSRNHEHTKALMHGDPQLWHDLCAQLAQISGAFLRVQAEAGASVVQLFDSWAGVLSRADYTASVQRALGHGARRRSPTSTCRASTSASARGSCSRSWARRAPTSSASTTASR